MPGLGLLPVSTVIEPAKTTRQVSFRFLSDERICHGYEIHMGHTESQYPVCRLNDGETDGCIVEGRCFGSYIHGILDNPAVLDWLLSHFKSALTESAIDYDAYRHSQYDALADWIREYVDIPKLYEILSYD